MRDVKSYEAELEAEELLLKKKRAVLAEFKRLFGENAKVESRPKIELSAGSTNKSGHKLAKKKSARRRIREAILTMPDTFTSRDLWNATCEDGNGPEIDRESSFQPYLTKLQEDGYVVKIQEHIGTTPALFKKGPESSKIIVD